MKNSNKIVQHLCYKLIKMLFGQSTIFGNKNQWPTDVNAGKKKYITKTKRKKILILKFQNVWRGVTTK